MAAKTSQIDILITGNATGAVTAMQEADARG